MVLDSLQGVAYKNDRQVVDMHIIKRWNRQGEPESVIVRVTYDGE